MQPQMTAEIGMEKEIAQMEQEDESQYQAIAPKGNFSAKSLNMLVRATNKLLPLFGQTPDYPMFKDGVKVFPTDFVRILGMFQGAVNQAVDSDSISEDYDFNMEELTNDAKVTFLAAKLSKLAGEKDFKQFLKEPPEEEMTEEEAMEEETVAPPTEEETDKLFMGRM